MVQQTTINKSGSKMIKKTICTANIIAPKNKHRKFDKTNIILYNNLIIFVYQKYVSHVDTVCRYYYKKREQLFEHANLLAKYKFN